MSDFKIIENEDINAAISVYDEAGTTYWKALKANPGLTVRTSFHQLRGIFDTCVIPAIEEVRRLDREYRDLHGYTDIELLNELIKRNEGVEAPSQASYGEGMLESLVEVGNDETAYIILHKDAIEYMNKPIDNKESLE